MGNYDLYINMSYNGPQATLTIEDTNVKLDKIDDILAEWIRGQSGKGKDNRVANEKDVYKIQMKVDLTYDHFTVSSDTGNHGLTTGILGTSLGKWKLSPELEERANQAV